MISPEVPMPWNKGELLREIRRAWQKGLDRAELRELERLARLYGATREEIARAKGLTPRRRRNRL
jgi:uncharacterized protein YprB with RNaseH-like and TPR domain